MSNLQQVIRNVRGISRLTLDIASGITTIVEDMHETISRRPLPGVKRPDGATRAHGLLAAGIYQSIRGINKGVCEVIDWPLARLQPEDPAASSTGEAQAYGVLNGICGDHLERTGNALAIDMQFHTSMGPLPLDTEGISRAIPEATGHIVVMVHGLCLTEHSWFRREESCLGSKLREHCAATTLYLRYNTGRHISTNGQELAELLEKLCTCWPVAVESLSLIGHSMGGLVIRSACWYAREPERNWLQSLDRIFFLGSPHHGSPLEKIGSRFDSLVQRIQYVEPLLVGSRRSAGIKDLRHGNLLDEDWRQEPESSGHKDRRRFVPTVAGVEYFVIAATVGRDDREVRGQLLGDLLVRVDSATGAHPDRSRCLEVPSENIRIFYQMDHFQLQEDDRVHQQILHWFRD